MKKIAEHIHQVEMGNSPREKSYINRLRTWLVLFLGLGILLGIILGVFLN